MVEEEEKKGEQQEIKKVSFPQDLDDEALSCEEVDSDELDGDLNLSDDESAA